MSDQEKLFNDYQPLALSIAGRIARRLRLRGVSRDDINNAALAGLWQASKRFAPERGVHFSTYAAPRIRGEVLDWVRQCDHLSRPHRRSGCGIRLVAMSAGIDLPDHSDPAEEPQMDDTLRCLLGVLSPAERRCVWLYHVRDLPMRQISVRLRVGESMVSRYLISARAKMRERLTILENSHV